MLFLRLFLIKTIKANILYLRSNAKKIPGFDGNTLTQVTSNQGNNFQFCVKINVSIQI